jgi:hypothetical protein
MRVSGTYTPDSIAAATYVHARHSDYLLALAACQLLGQQVQGCKGTVGTAWDLLAVARLLRCCCMWCWVVGEPVVVFEVSAEGFVLLGSVGRYGYKPLPSWACRPNDVLAGLFYLCLLLWWLPPTPFSSLFNN